MVREMRSNDKSNENWGARALPQNRKQIAFLGSLKTLPKPWFNGRKTVVREMRLNDKLNESWGTHPLPQTENSLLPGALENLAQTMV